MTAAPLTRPPLVPDRTHAQRMRSLGEANAVRVRNAKAKREIGEMRRDPSEVLHNPAHASLKVMDLLLAIPKVGRSKALKTLTAARVSPSKRLGGLTDRQRSALLVELGSYPQVKRVLDSYRNH